MAGLGTCAQDVVPAWLARAVATATPPDPIAVVPSTGSAAPSSAVGAVAVAPQ